MEELTKAEERIMQIMWKIKKGFVKDIMVCLPDGENTPYNTISSVVRILVSKGFLDYKAYGKTYEYFPKVKKTEYRGDQLRKFIAGYYGNSPASLVSNLVKEENLTPEEIEKLKKIVDGLD